MDFDPKVVGLFVCEDFWKMIFWLVLKFETSPRGNDILKDFGFF
jgi:hypothetical protein